MQRILSTTLLLFAIGFSPWLRAAGEVEAANQLIGEGKYIEAFELLEPLEFDMSGDETFDLLFGFAALEAGHISLSTLALERVLAVNPDNDTARFHLARAYFVLNDFDGARREFEMLLSMNPTAGVRETVGQYLDAIAAREPQAATVTSGFVAAGIGNDSNVTGGTSLDQVFFPTGPYPVSGEEAADADSYSTLSAGFDLVHRFSEVNSAYAGGDVTNRGHSDRDDLDYRVTNLRGGYQRAIGNQVLRGGLALADLRLDGDDYQDSSGVELEWRNTIAQRTQIGVVLALTQYRHVDTNEQSDYDDTRLSLSYLRVLGEQGDIILSTALDIGQEDDTNDRADGDLDYTQVSLTGQMQFSDANSGFVQLSYKNSGYGKDNLLILKERSESQTSLVAGLVFELSNSVSIRATAVILNTSSNVALYDASREDVSVTLRKDFL